MKKKNELLSEEHGIVLTLNSILVFVELSDLQDNELSRLNYRLKYASNNEMSEAVRSSMVPLLHPRAIA